MPELLGHYNYWIVIVLMMTGFYTVIARPNLVKKIIGTIPRLVNVLPAPCKSSISF